MADKLISSLTAATAIADADYLVIETAAGNSRKITGANAKASINPSTSPLGRLTLTSATPVLTTDATAQGTIYYSEYVGNSCPVYDGTTTRPLTFSNLSCILDATNALSGSVYDVFLWSSSGTATLGFGPAWTSTTARGTGAGTTELQLKNGIWTNKNAITLHNNSVSSGSIAANQATYLGSFYATANAQTGMSFRPAPASGGTNNILGLYNAYNRILIVAMNTDNNNSWSYSTASYRARDNNANNKISFLDGLQQSFITATTQILGNGANSVIGIDLDSTTATPQATGQTNGVSQITVSDRWGPQLGLHYVCPVENAKGGTSVTFYGQANDNTAATTLMIEM